MDEIAGGFVSAGVGIAGEAGSWVVNATGIAVFVGVTGAVVAAMPSDSPTCR